MGLQGTYQNTNTGETLTITSANDANGQIAGTITSNGRTLNLTGHYHYANSGGPATSIAFYAMADDPNVYEGWACSGTAPNFSQLNAMGSRTTINGSTMTTIGVGGLFVRK